MNELIKINYENADRPTVLGRELHKALEIKSNYTTWFDRMCEYGFVENTDFKTCFPNLESENQHGGQNKIDHQMTIEMAKEICMIQRNELGKRFYKYFDDICFNQRCKDLNLPTTANNTESLNTAISSKIVVINNSEMTVKEYRGQRVVTFKDIDLIHQRADGTARKRFNDNRKHFIEGEDYFKITSSEFRTAIGNMDKRQQNDIILLTESGYLMLVKSFTDDLAWKVQRELVKSYFRLKEIEKPLDSYMIENPVDRAKRWIEEYEERHALEVKVEQQQELIKTKDEKLEKLKPFVQFAMKLQNTNDTVSMEQAAKMLKEDGIEIGRNTLFKILREHKVLMENNSPYQKYVDLDLFEIKAVIKEDKYNKEHMYPVTRITGKGLIFVNKKLRKWFNI